MIVNPFTGDGFNMIALTRSINRAPYVPGRIGEMGLYQTEGITSPNFALEIDQGVVSLLENKPRGGTPGALAVTKPRMIPFITAHLPLSASVKADDIAGMRQFGSENDEESAANLIAKKLARMRTQHEVTQEYYRANGIQGQLLDANGSTVISNLFTAFNEPEASFDFTLGTSTADIKGKCLEVKDHIEDALGAAAYDHVHAICGRTWFRRFINHAEVKYAYQYFQDGAILRNDPRKGFEFAGIVFEEYNAKVGNRPFIPVDVCRFFPVGVDDLFIQHYAPADWMETVNTQGLPFYAKQVEMDLNTGVRIHSQSNPFMLCTRPRVLAKGTTSN